MKAPRFLISLERTLGDGPLGPSPSIVLLDQQESHHLRDVLRLKPGDAVELFDPAAGRSFSATVSGCSADSVSCAVQSERPLAHGPRVYLLVGMPSPAIADFLVEKSVELGAAGIAFFSAERSQERLKSERAAKRLERFGRIARAALKQSGAVISPDIRCAAGIAELLSIMHPKPPAPGELRMLCSAPVSRSAADLQALKITALLRSETESPTSFPHALEKVPESVDSYLLIGPEGGFTESEQTVAVQAQYVPTSLGPFVLRTETAAITALSLTRLLRSE